MCVCVCATTRSTTAANIDHASLKLNGFETRYVLGSARDISRRIASHYVSQILRELYKVSGRHCLFVSAGHDVVAQGLC